MSTLTQSTAWQALLAHHENLRKANLSSLFHGDPHRAQRYHLEAAGIFVDYSRQQVTDQTLSLLQSLASQAQLSLWIEKLFREEKINDTEDRYALHTALRNQGQQPVMVEGEDVMLFVRQVLAQIKSFTLELAQGSWRGFDGQTITDVVNIGIGGSDVGPAMVCQALEPYTSGPRVHFISNADSAHLGRLQKTLKPNSTLFIVSSKSFTTQETMLNAHSARQWVLGAGASPQDLSRHFVAVSSNLKAVKQFGIDPQYCFQFRDWVGGRYSLWSAIGLPIAIAVGFERFIELLEGAYAMDQHFRNSPQDKNLPVVMGLLGIWNINFRGASNHALLPYDQSLSGLVNHLQQLMMESNGKSVDRAGRAVDYATGPLLWGGVGTNGQHSFYQWLHQGTAVFSADFMAPLESHYPLGQHHQVLLANFLAQPEALMQGRSLAQARAACRAAGISDEASLERLAPARVFPGNRPSSTLLFKKLTPHTLGALVALYEHITFVQSVIWNINPFDQWGVELGKELCAQILPQLRGETNNPSSDPSTAALIARCRGA
jgi:glucose-6-phosphate isomerase